MSCADECQWSELVDNCERCTKRHGCERPVLWWECHEYPRCCGLRILVSEIESIYFHGAAAEIASFGSYELSKQWMTSEHETERQNAVKVLLCGGLAGVVTWASIFPLDVIKTRVQTQSLAVHQEEQLLLVSSPQRRVGNSVQHGAIELARDAYRAEGIRVFFRGLGVCSVRAFLVNAVQVRCSMPVAARFMLTIW